MTKMKLTERKLRRVYMRGKRISNDFKDLSKMLLKFPESLQVVRFALNKGRKKFGEGCGINPVSIKKIEDGKARLGTIRLNKILQYVENKKVNFRLKNILLVFNSLMKKSEGFPYFSRLSRKRVQEIAVKGVKSKFSTMDKSERIIYSILKSNEIQFERQALLDTSKSTIMLIIIDFAIPTGKRPEILIEVTNGRIEHYKTGHLLTPIGMRKLILGYRIKKLLPDSKLILFTTGKLDTVSYKLLSEAYDYIFTEKNVPSLQKILKGLMNAR